MDMHVAPFIHGFAAMHTGTIDTITGDGDEYSCTLVPDGNVVVTVPIMAQIVPIEAADTGYIENGKPDDVEDDVMLMPIVGEIFNIDEEQFDVSVSRSTRVDGIGPRDTTNGRVSAAVMAVIRG